MKGIIENVITIIIVIAIIAFMSINIVNQRESVMANCLELGNTPVQCEKLFE